MTNETKWTIDPAHSEISFQVKHLMIAAIKGKFKTFDASVYTCGKDFTTAEIDLWIEAASVDTGDLKRDEHLRSTEFFDTENHLQITFRSNTVWDSDTADNHELWGELTIKGISRKIKLQVQFGGIITDPWGTEKAGFKVEGKIKRSDWELNWNTMLEAGGVMVSDEVNIVCEIELINAGKKDLSLVVETNIWNNNVPLSS